MHEPEARAAFLVCWPLRKRDPWNQWRSFAEAEARAAKLASDDTRRFGRPVTAGDFTWYVGGGEGA